jgi:HEPN domain-containing protein
MDDAKRQLVRSWLRKALHDLAASRMLGAGDPPLLDAAVYHCQQAAEKALKGFLVYWDCEPPRVHDVARLLEQAMEIEPVFDTWQDAADRLTPLATRYRYPGLGDDPSREAFEEAVDDADTIVRQVLAYVPQDIVIGIEDC